MDQQDLALAFEQTTVYQLASTWLDNPGEDPAVLEWLKALADADPEQRRMAVFHMGRSRDPRVRIPLLVALRDLDDGVRGHAASALFSYRDVSNVEPLIAAFLEGGRSVRSTAVLALGFLEDRRAVKPLLTVFEEEVMRRRQMAEEEGKRYHLDL